MKSKFSFVLVPILGLALATPLMAAPKKQVLVVFSSESKITVLKDRKTGETVTHPTGFFLSEAMIPIEAIVKAGYEPVFASPSGAPVTMDAVSDNAMFFGGDKVRQGKVKALCIELGMCAPQGLVGTKKTLSLSDASKHLDSYAGLLVPGGHAPFEDLWHNKDLGVILHYFHTKAKPTGLICHGPIALLAATDDPIAVGAALREGKMDIARAKAGKWPYAGYSMTVFSTKEEKQEEPGQDNVLGGFVMFYPDEALDAVGGKVNVRALGWQSHVVRDRELITGANPFSDHEFAAMFVAALKGKK